MVSRLHHIIKIDSGDRRFSVVSTGKDITHGHSFLGPGVDGNMRLREEDDCRHPVGFKFVRGDVQETTL